MTKLVNEDYQYRPTLLKTLLGIVLSVLTLFACMWLSNNFVSGIVNSFVNLISLAIAVVVLLKTTRLQKLLGEKIVAVTVVTCILIGFFNIIFSTTFVFGDFINGITSSLEHPEHTLMYKEMEIIATRLGEGATLEQATDGLPLNQYYNVFVYASMLFLFGGVNITNMCIFATLHTLICASCMVLIVEKYGVKDPQKIKIVYFTSLLQPLLLSTYNYNKIIIGEAFILVAMYIYIYTYHNPNLNLLAFPVYAYLMWSVRLQYLVLAVILCILTIFLGRKKLNLNTLLNIVLILLIMVFVALSMNIREFLNTELNFSNYTEGASYGLTAIPMRILRSFLPYFPFTNIFSDKYWTFNIFCIFQIVMNCTMWYFVVFDAMQMKRLKQVFTNPLIIAAIGFLLAGTLSALHTTYVSVGTIFLSAELEEVSPNRFTAAYLLIFFVLVIFSFVYSMLGLTGTGISQIVV